MTAVLIVAIVIGLPLVFAYFDSYLKHRERIASLQNSSAATDSQLDQLRNDYQEFVLGVDARMKRIEDKLRMVESKLSQNADSADLQNIHRG